MPKLSSVLQNAEATWADQVDKKSIQGKRFWIYGAKDSNYQDESDRDVQLVVLNIALVEPDGGLPSLQDRAVITLGYNEDRAAILEYFSEHSDPIGPCRTFQVDLKGGRTFWRLEDAGD